MEQKLKMQLDVNVNINLSENSMLFFKQLFCGFTPQQCIGFGEITSAQTTSAQTASAQTASAQTTSAQTASAQTASAQTASAQTTSAQTTSAQTASAQTASAQKSICIEQLQKLLVEKVNNGNNRELIKDKLTEMGSPSISKLEETKYTEMFNFLNNL